MSKHSRAEVPAEVLSVRAQRKLEELATLWPGLEARVAPSGQGSDLGTKIQKSEGEERPLPIEMPIVAHMRAVQLWLDGLVRQIQAAQALAPATAVKVVKKPAALWRPPVGVPETLREIARNKIGVVCPTGDPGSLENLLATTFEITLKRHVRETAELIAPTRKRWRSVHVGCIEKIEADDAIVECTGEYGIWFNPHFTDMVPDLVCNKDRSHTILPSEWQRAGRRSGYNSEVVRDRLRLERANR